MQSDLKSNIDIKQIIAEERVEIHFQPILSVKKHCIIGVEALARGIEADGVTLIPPIRLFESAKTAEWRIELDRLCRRKAMEKYKLYTLKNPDLILFLNFDTSIVDSGVVGSGNLQKTAMELDLKPQNIVIEIIESSVENCDAMDKFIKTYKNYGFLIALDDFGAGHSNLFRLANIKPDILKIDRSLIQNIDTEFHKQEIVRSLGLLAKKIGALVLAEGVETKGEVLASLQAGAELMQGFYFAKPKPDINSVSCQVNENVLELMPFLKNYLIQSHQARIQKYSEYSTMIERLCLEFCSYVPEEFEERLKDIIRNEDTVECVYILNQRGIQITQTECGTTILSQSQSHLFHPAEKGEDHSLKEYFIHMANGATQYTSESYISLASGNLCVTISNRFRAKDNEEYILCLDINHKYLGE